MIKRKILLKNPLCQIISLIILICGGGLIKGYSKNNISENSERILSSNDSIVFDIIEILKEEKNLSKNRREEIGKKINSFPGRILRRDTSSYYLQTVLGIAFHEYVTEDYDKAIEMANKFSSSIVEPGLLDNITRYSAIKFTPSALITKKKYKDVPEPPLFGSSQKSSSDFEFDRPKLMFFADIFEGLPMNLDLNTYKKLLEEFIVSDGSPSMLNVIGDKGFYNNCKKSGREDVLQLVKSLWNLSDANFTYNKTSGLFKFIDLEPPITDFSEVNKKLLKEFELKIYEADGNIAVIDSLISINQLDSVGKYMYNYQFINLARGNLRDIIEKSETYEKYIPDQWLSNFYGYWGVAHQSLGNFEEAKSLFSKSFDHKQNKENFSGSVLNYATILAEEGKVEEAILLITTQEDKAKTIEELFDYWDTLGYIYSFSSPEKALIYYEKADSVLLVKDGSDFNAGFYSNWPSNNVTRHYCRECRVMQNDLYRWKSALKQAGLSGGIGSNFKFYGGLSEGFYLSESGRLKNLLFDFEGAIKDFERAERIFQNLDSADYRIKWFNNAWQDLHKFNDTYGADVTTILKTLRSDQFSSLHKIWLIGNLVAKYYSTNKEHSVNIDFINNELSRNLGETMLALSNYESRYLPLGIVKIQEILMTEENLKNETGSLANLNLLRKGLLHTSKSELEKKLISSTGELKQEYLELIRLRKELNHAYAYEDSLKVRKLLPLIANQESNLYYSLKDSINPGSIISSNINSIKEKLGKNDLAIDFIEIQKDGVKNFGAFVISPNDEVSYYDLAISLNINGQSRYEYENLWQPIIDLMKGKDNIYFYPDGILNNIGIEFLKDEDGKAMIENYRLHRVSHLRNIEKKENPISGEIAIVGVSDHNSPIGKGGTIYRGNWTDLPDVEYEIKLIDNILTDNSHQVFYNDDAIEENIKKLDGKDISVLHFSTHGVYRDIDSLQSVASVPQHFDHNIAIRTLKTDRREISGIVLRKGNLSWKMPHLLDDEDDILTAEEIEVMNFPNLQLTVLSACDSGLGEINSEGAQGLQRAFRIAGSKNIICSLNKVNDYWSAQFMGELYKNLAEGLSIYDSFRKAQIDIKTAAPDNPEAWSSYILIE